MRRILMMFSCLFLAGCSIVMSSGLPVSRPPSEISTGLPQDVVDKKYGDPIAAGMNEDGTEYIEQIQFIDGVHVGWKIFRICTHFTLDGLTLFLWEFIGTPIEMLNSSYPEYVYYIVYDNNNRIVRAIPQNSPEGRRIAALSWSSPRLPPSVIRKGKNARILAKRKMLFENRRNQKD